MRLIDADDKENITIVFDNEGRGTIKRIDAPTVQAVPIPDNATNGDVVKAVFNNDAFINFVLSYEDFDWWNAPYKGSDTE